MMQQTPHIDAALIERYLAGEASARETVAVDQWLAEDARRARVVGAIREGRVLRHPVDPAAEWERIWEMLRVEDAAPPKRVAAGMRTLRGMRLLGSQTVRRWILPATLSGVSVAAIFFAMRATPNGLGTTHTYATKTGQRAAVTLGDGTRVILAPQTTLRLVRFGAKARTVVLDGEAYFDVQRASGAPFVVRTAGVDTRVLGTEFLVRHYANDESVRVAVSSGKVNLSSFGVGPRKGDVALVAGNIGEVRDSTVMVRTANIDDETAWLHDELVFNHAPMTEVLAALTRWYGYQFRYRDSTLIRQQVTVGLSTKSSAKALSALKYVLNVSLEFTGDTITLTPKTGRPGSKTPRTKAYDVWTPSKEVGR